MNLIKAASFFVLLCALPIKADYIYEANQDLIDLNNHTDATNMASGDDQASSAFNLDFTFTFYGEDFTSARMATNGCLHFGSSGSHCNDYTPDPLPEITYTLYPFWTDLIRDNDSKVLAKNFTDKSVFGWYNLREYNRASDNSFEVVLWKADDSFEFRYGALDIINHDVLIGEQGSADELYTYLFHDQCGKGTTNVTGTCVSSTWNQTAFNTSLENGGSLYSSNIDCSNPLNDSSCTGYDSAYLTQQCEIDSLYSTQCPSYWDALFDYECSIDTQYSPACPGYTVFTYVYETNYEEDNYGYTETYYAEDYYYEEETYYPEETETEYYQVYNDDGGTGTTPADDTIGINPPEDHIESPTLPTIYDDPPIFIAPPSEHIEQPQLPIIIDSYTDDILIMTENYTVNYELPTTENVLLAHFEHEEHFERNLEEITNEEIFEQIAESNEAEIIQDEDEEESDDEIEDRDEDIEVAESEGKGKKKRAEQLNVVANTIRAAMNSVSGTSSGSSTSATGTSVSNNTINTAVASSSSSGGISMSNSPSISEQVSSSAVQTQQVLTMSADSVSNTSTMASNESANNTTSETESNVSTTDSSINIGGSVNTQDSQNTTFAQAGSSVGSESNTVGSMDTEISETIAEMSPSEADLVADQIIAQNIQNQQEQIEQEQQETGEYADSTTLVAFMGYVPGFNEYTTIQIPNASAWYEPEDIYANVTMSDNNQAFMNMFGNSMDTINDMVQLQPKL